MSASPIKDALEHLIDIGVKANLPQPFHPDPEPEHVYLLRAPSGAYERVEAAAGPRVHKALDLSAIVDFACREGLRPDTEIWYSRERVRVYLDPSVRRDYIELPLTLSRPMTAMVELESRVTPFDQKDFLRLLRLTLSVPEHPLVELSRSVRFDMRGESAGVARKGEVSVGNKIESKMQGAANFPEDTGIKVPVFVGFLDEMRYSVHCDVEIDPESRKFCLTPYPGATERAVRQAEKEILTRLEAMVAAKDGTAPVKIHYGIP